MKLTSRNGRLSCIGCLLALPWLFILVLLAGCPQDGGNGNNNGNGNGNGNESPGAGEIITPSSSFGLSVLDPPFQVRYSVPDDATDISGYRFAVADSSLNSPAIGEKVTIAANLQAGSNKFFDFDPSEAGVGYHRVGVSFSFAGESDFADSSGVIHVEGPPDPIFIQPAQPLTVIEEGGVVTVSFDARDPEGEVQWRLFYLDSQDTLSAPPDQIGTQLAVGEGNVGTVSFRTEGLIEGNYDLGLSATDSGMSISATVAAGQLDRIVTIPENILDAPKVRVVAQGSIIVPTITITNPGTSDVPLYKDETFTIRFTASVPQPGATGSVEVFRDTDTNVTNGFTIISDDLTDSDTQVQFPTGVPDGTYYIGATVRDGVNAPVTDYSAGRVIVTRTITLAVTEPNTSLAYAPGSPVSIRWTTNAPATSGTVDVFSRRVDSSGQPTGSVIPIVTAGAMTLRTATFTSATSGLFQITVRLNITGSAPILGNAPRPVRVSTLPAVAWLGSIAEPTPRVDGAIFGGVNFEDNAGSAFTRADDFDGDGLSEFVIAAKYGKPFFVNPNGTGPGEAYVIYGERGLDRLDGIFNLSSVGTPTLRGVTLTGVRTFENSSETEGINAMLAIPDVDDDGVDEVSISFTSTDSDSPGPFNDRGAFLNGGVIILSSTNSQLEDPDNNNAVINLDQVGQRFLAETPTGGEGALDDLLEFSEGDDGEDPPIPPGCVPGSDGVPDTVVPLVDGGFTIDLGEPLFEQLGFEVIPPGTEEAPGVCVTQFQVDLEEDDECVVGAFPAVNTAREPFGARIIGQSPGDGFGASVSITKPSQAGQRSDLLISSPPRTALAEETEGLGVDADDSGVAYLFSNRRLWNVDPEFPGLPPRPHQYVVDEESHCGNGLAPNLNATAIAGNFNDSIEVILGIDDFNLDGRADFAVGAPAANSVYIAFRRDPDVESDFVLSKLSFPPDAANRLDGILIRSDASDSFGFGLAEGFDFNADDIPDVAISSPEAGTGTGEVIILFGGTGIVSPENGLSVQNLLTQTRTASGGPVAVRIRGATVAGEKGRFGFNIANAGDVDNDGLDDLLIAAPEASPRFDAEPNDGVDELSTLGVDINLDGVRDEVPGDDELRQAGLVYLILGKNRLDQVRTCQGTTKACTTAADCPAGAGCTLTDPTINIELLGTSRLRGLIVAGRRAGDYLGGGDAGNIEQGGTGSKSGRGRSHGLSTAGDVDGDGRDDMLMGALLADPRRDPNTGTGVTNGGEAYLIYGSNVP